MATRAAEWERSLREADNGSEPLRDVFIRLFLEADARLAGVEGTASSVAALQVLMTQDANTLINAVVTPLLAQIRAVADMGVLFSATSVSETAIGTGVKTFTIPVGMRTAFAPAAQLAIVAADDTAKAMWARKLGYNSETGVLTVDVYSTQGIGTVSSWSITAGIAASMAAHVAVAATGMVPVGNLQGALAAISAAISDDPDFGADVLAALAARYTKAEADALLAGKQTKTDASSALAGVTPAGNTLPYFTNATTAGLTALSEYLRGSGLLGAADQAAALAAIGAAASHNPRITGNLRFGARTPIDKIFMTSATTNRVCVYDTRLDSDGGAWRTRTQDTLAYVIAPGAKRGARRDFPAIAVIAMDSLSEVRIYDAEEVGSDGAPQLWAASSLLSSAPARAIKALNGIVCVAGPGGLALVDIPGDGRRFYLADRVSYYTPLGDTLHLGFAKIRDDLTKNIPSIDTKDVDLRAFAGAPIGGNGLPTPTIAVATAAGASVIFPSGEIVDITRSGGYVAVSLDSDTRIRLVTPEGDVEVGPIPSADIANTSWRLHSWAPTLGPVSKVAGAAEATTRGLLMRAENLAGYAIGMTAHIGPTFNTGWMPPNTRRALFCDNIASALTGATPLADDCTSTTGWTLGAGWAHDTGEFDHASGTAALDRVLSGLTAGVRYRVRFLVGNRSAGSLAASLLTAGDEAGALSVAANGEHVVGFTATATTDTLRFTPTTDFNGSIQDVRVEVSVADRSIVGRDLRVNGALTALSGGGIGELRPMTGWGSANFVDDVWTADLDFAGDFCVAFNSFLSPTDATMIQRASAATSGARWEIRFAAGVVYFEINDGTNGAAVSATVQQTADYSPFVFVRRGSSLELWQSGVLTATASAAGVGSLANGSAGIRFGGRVDGTKATLSTRLRGVIIAEYAPSTEQIETMFLGGRDIIQPASLCCLGGATAAVSRVSRDPITGQIAAAAAGVSVFKGLMRTDYFSTLNSQIVNDAIVDVSMRGATIATAGPAGGYCYRSELAAVMVESARIGAAPSDHEHRLATAALAGFMAPADKAKLDGLNKGSVGLGNVDNTADTAKPVSTTQAAAIAAAVRIRPNVPQRNYLAGATWLSSTSAADNNWSGLCWAPELGLFVSVGTSGTGNRVMTSPDGITWTIRTSAMDNNWRSVCWSAELGLLVAVADTGTGDRVMTSPDGVTWTIRTSAADNPWASICWSPQRGLFVAVAGSGTNRAMTSPDGINWTARLTPGVAYRRVIWAAELGLFVASAGTGTGNRISTSPEGLTWTARTSAADNDWRGLAWSPQLGLLVATAVSGTGNRVMTSPDGITWTARTSPADNSWTFVEWAPQIGLFVAIASAGVGTGDRVMTSPDGITWTIRTSATDNAWQVVRWSPELGLFCAVANSGTGNRAMTSVSAFKYPYRS